MSVYNKIDEQHLLMEENENERRKWTYLSFQNIERETFAKKEHLLASLCKKRDGEFMNIF